MTARRPWAISSERLIPCLRPQASDPSRNLATGEYGPLDPRLVRAAVSLIDDLFEPLCHLPAKKPFAGQ